MRTVPTLAGNSTLSHFINSVLVNGECVRLFCGLHQVESELGECKKIVKRLGDQVDALEQEKAETAYTLREVKANAAQLSQHNKVCRHTQVCWKCTTYGRCLRKMMRCTSGRYTAGGGFAYT